MPPMQAGSALNSSSALKEMFFLCPLGEYMFSQMFVS